MKEFKIGGLEIFMSKTISENRFRFMMLPSLDFIKELIKVWAFDDYPSKQHYKYYSIIRIDISWLFFYITFSVKKYKYDNYE